jgi:spore germination protein
MLIHVVQPKDTIQSIADYYGISIVKLIQDNGLDEPTTLVTGQSIVIAIPEITYTVKEGDTLVDIANSYNVTVIQLLINNPFLSEREYIYPGDTIVIKYNTKGKITTHGNTLPFINKEALRKTLPYLTYLSVLNFTATKEGEIITYYDDAEIIQITKDYGVLPLMLLTTLTIQGEANIGITYDLLLNEDIQNRQIDNILNILKTKGYYGINISFQHINVSNQQLYEGYFSKISRRINDEGYPVFVTINPNLASMNNGIGFQRVDYSLFDQLAQNIIFMDYEWATNVNPPSPISSIYNIDVFLDYVIRFTTPSKVIIGMASIGYDWELPFSAGLSSVNALTLENAIDLARNEGAIIHFDEISQTPFYRYTKSSYDNEIEHIVWFIDARSIDALLGLISKYSLLGTSVWNITIYNPQLWLVIYSQYEIEKVFLV